MISRQIEQLASQRNAERAAQAAKAHATRTIDSRRTPAPAGLRSQTGWAIVSIGLRIAESGSR
jgi:hypothetical protein